MTEVQKIICGMSAKIKRLEAALTLIAANDKSIGQEFCRADCSAIAAAALMGEEWRANDDQIIGAGI